jgi:hypothetical protein
VKLAEALIQRADLQKRVEQLKERLLRNARVQEGDEPSEDPRELLEELEGATADLVVLIQRINRTNSTCELQSGESFSDALATRDILRLKHRVYRNFAQAATVTQARYSKSEVKFQSTVNVRQMQQRADELAKEHRDLDASIQEANWSTELSE